MPTIVPNMDVDDMADLIKMIKVLSKEMCLLHRPHIIPYGGGDYGPDRVFYPQRVEIRWMSKLVELLESHHESARSISTFDIDRMNTCADLVRIQFAPLLAEWVATGNLDEVRFQQVSRAISAMLDKQVLKMI